MRRWFLPHTADVLRLLRAQADVTLEGMRAFTAWSSGEVDTVLAVRQAEHDADSRQRALLVELRSAFSLPLDGEDLYELSERLDRVLDSAKDCAREAEVMRLAPDQPMADMAGAILDALEHVVAAFDVLVSHPAEATEEADRAVSASRRVEKLYRIAMSALLEVEDLHEVMGRRELYRRYARLADAVDSVAHRVWYAVVKSG
jgi:uncharacterized protein Yka (UPF0111/DUF47 family)